MRRGGWLKRMLPRGLYGRAALILIAPVVTIQLVLSVLVIQRLYEDVTRQMTVSLAAGLGSLVRDIAQDPAPAAVQGRLVALAGPLGAEFALPAPAGLASADIRSRWDLSGRVVVQTLRTNLPVVAVDLSDPRRVALRLATAAGDLGVGFDRRRVSPSNPHQLIVLMLGTSLVMTFVAFLFLRNQLRPIRRLARAAEALGRGRVVPYRPTGANEVRAAGSAFLDMRARIERHIEQRTLMLSGVSHDLRTPLTRMRLNLAMLPDSDETREIARDIDEMQALLDAFLAFARADATEDEAEPVDPVALVGTLVARAARAGLAVRMRPGAPGPDQAPETRIPDGAADPRLVQLRPAAIARAVENLIGNAGRYGDHAEVTVSFGERSLRISVEDDGPGIPKERREEALRPFVRLDDARNQNSGAGVGLGLAIAADAARSHGGTLRLGTSERLGGLKAEIVLPA